MNRMSFAIRAKHLAIGVLAGGLVIGGGQAMAQPGEITVVAPHVVRQNVGQTPGGIPIDVVSLAQHVSYSDLDLKTDSGVTALEGRITDASKQACGQLEILYPAAQFPVDPANKDCVKTAVEGAMAQATVAIAAARN